MFWDFNDPDAGDTQSAYSLRRTIGTTVRYRNATGWQTAEDAATKLAGDTSSLALGTAWGAATDQDHHYAVKTWDAQDAVSPWSADTRVVPSVKVTQ